MDSREFLNNQVYPRLSHQVVFGNLEGVRKRSNGISATCPKCGKKGYFWAYDGKQYGHCSCGEVIGWWQHIKASYGLSKSRDVLLKLAELAMVDLPEGKRENEGKMAIETADDLKRFTVQYGRWCLNTVISKPANNKDETAVKIRAYLNSRGFTDDDIKRSDILYINKERLLRLLDSRGVQKELISETGILTAGFGSHYNLLLPFIDKGEIKGFIGRLNPWLDETPDMPKYKNSIGLLKDSPYMLSEADGKDKYILLVEGPMDAIKLNLMGIPATALCGCEFGRKIEESLLNAKSNIVISALDDDKAGKKGTIELIKRVHGVNNKAVFVMPDYNGYKDPLEMVNVFGKDAFNINLAEECGSWLLKNVSTELLGSEGDYARVKSLMEYAALCKRMPENERQMFVKQAAAAASLTAESVNAAVNS